MAKEDWIYDGMYGLAVADALGVPYETETLDGMRESPCMGMVGFRQHNQPAGCWSDDTSMSLCVADSLGRGYDPTDMMKKFSRWRFGGEYTATGRAFDVGRTCGRAIGRFREGLPAEYCGDYDVGGNGNGALMRTFPIALYQCVSDCSNSLANFLLPIHEVSSLTHAHEIGLMCCGLFSLTLREILADDGSRSLMDAASGGYSKGMEAYGAMAGEFGRYLTLFTEPMELACRAADELPSWGYALNTWNIALWSLLTTSNYRDCVLKVINVGGDTDTNAAVAGALAGVAYGRKTIPSEWLDALLNKRLIDEVCGRFNKGVLGIEIERAVIDFFVGEHAFLAMKAPTSIEIGGHRYQNTAAAFFALGVPEELRGKFEDLSAKRARRLFKTLPRDGLAERHLYEATRARFEQNPRDRQRLLSTAPLEIVHDTTGSHDNVLGRCGCRECRGKEYLNLYGKVLMRVRAELA